MKHYKQRKKKKIRFYSINNKLSLKKASTTLTFGEEISELLDGNWFSEILPMAMLTKWHIFIIAVHFWDNLIKYDIFIMFGYFYFPMFVTGLAMQTRATARPGTGGGDSAIFAKLYNMTREFNLQMPTFQRNYFLLSSFFFPRSFSSDLS